MPISCIAAIVVVLILGLAVGWNLSSRGNRERLEQLQKQIAERDKEISKKRLDEKQAIERAEEQAADIIERGKEEVRQQKEAAEREIESDRRAAEAEFEKSQAKIETAEAKAKEIVLAARTKAQEEAERAKRAAEQRERQREKQQHNREQLVAEKESLLASRELELAKRDNIAQKKLSGLTEKENEMNRLLAQQKSLLEEIAHLSEDDAKRQLMEQYKNEARRAAAQDAKRIEETIRDEAEKRAKGVVALAIQRFAGEYVQERSVTSVHLPNDDLKGRIIGREGRNIRALQEATGVDFIVDDTPETIVVSSFDPIRREVARITLEKLLADGRIHPTRIEEIVNKSNIEVEKSMRAAAEQALLELSITRVHPELLKLLGRLRYRYSYAQNVLRHSVEAGFLAGLMAAELGQDVQKARRAGLLHDIGKAVSHEQEGGHALVGAQIARKCGEDDAIVNAIACHHNDEPCSGILGHLVTAADTLSGARPGARREMLESYVKRLEELERVSESFNGVEKAYAIQAGREIRVLVEPSEVSDAESALLAHEIAKHVEEKLTYPGQIRVTVVRETRAIDYAK